MNRVAYDAIKYALMAQAMLYLSLFFVDKSMPIAFLLFCVGTLIAIVDFYTVKYLIQMEVEDDCNFYKNYPKRCCDWFAKKLEAFLKCRM